MALPNKGVIYPHLICEDVGLLCGHTSPCPQWRKYIGDVARSGVEILDMYPAFRNWALEHRDDSPLYAKAHNISSIGAKLVADSISDYLRLTAPDIQQRFELNQVRLIWDNAEHYINYDAHGKTYSSEESDIAIFGDCNLQNHAFCGSGITGNLAYNLQYPIQDAGRLLLFDDKREKDNEMSISALQALRQKSIVIYVAFASASFVRTSGIGLREMIHHPTFNNHKWANFTLA